jgi:polyphosphate kinase
MYGSQKKMVNGGALAVAPRENEQSRESEPNRFADPSLYFNRELSLLEFNRRVYEQAVDPTVPLLERLRFLCIASSNLDEFFEIRVAGLKKHVELGTAYSPADKKTADEVISEIHTNAGALVDAQYELLNNDILPALAKENIHFLKRDVWTAKQRDWIRTYFETQVLPILSPIRLDPSHPFPRVLNKALHYIVTLGGIDAFGQAGGRAVLQAPRVLPRFIRLPDNVCEGGDNFVFLTSIIHAHVEALFPGMEVTGCHQFRVTRDSDLILDEEEIDDLKAALEGELNARRFGGAVRLEVANTCPDDIIAFLLARFDLEHEDLYRVHGPVNLARLISVPDQLVRSDLKYLPFVQGTPERASQESDLFGRISEDDILVHHPYESFSVVLDFVRQAANDPQVLAIKQTLYRAGAESALEDLLYDAALAGKEVTVVVELRARFDEAANISLAERLQSAGAHVVYGVVGYKTHAKMLMVVRREGNRLRRYVHLATGNYHAKTTRMYTDFGLFTAQPKMCKEVHDMFLLLTSVSQAPTLERLLCSPFTLYEGLLEKIHLEAKNAREGKKARIIAKMNSLVDPGIIEALYKASCDGVEIDLIVRGVCCLRPGVVGISEKIRVRSVVGRFLEHTRVSYFENGGTPVVFCSSADWMPRNLHKRVEACFPIENPELRDRVIADGLLSYLHDNTQTWHLREDGSYDRPTAESERAYSAQSDLLRRLGD